MGRIVGFGLRDWIPACAGMTRRSVSFDRLRASGVVSFDIGDVRAVPALLDSRLRGNDGKKWVLRQAQGERCYLMKGMDSSSRATGFPLARE